MKPQEKNPVRRITTGLASLAIGRKIPSGRDQDSALATQLVRLRNTDGPPPLLSRLQSSELREPRIEVERKGFDELDFPEQLVL